jgi:cytochrome c oxidase cbb3-type subunit 3
MSVTAADAERGKQLFVSVCAAYCHSRDEGDREAPDLFDCVWRYGGSPEEIFASIANGVPGTRMIPFAGKLPEGDRDIYNIIAYLGEKSRCENADG